MRKFGLIAGGLVVVILALAVYFGSPFFAVQSLIDAAHHGDKAKLDAMIDFPAVRDGLKVQLKNALIDRMAKDPEVQNSPFAALALGMATAMVDKTVDAYVTPESIGNLAAGQTAPVAGGETAPAGQLTPQPAPKPQAKTAKPKVAYRYVTLDRVEATVPSNNDPKAVVRFDFERRNLISWKLVKIDVSGIVAESAKSS